MINLRFLTLGAAVLILFEQAMTVNLPVTASTQTQTVSPTAIAQMPPDDGDRDRPPAPPWMDEVNLSAEQQQQIQALHQQLRQDTSPLRQQLQDAREQMRSLFASDASADQLRQQHQQIQTLHQQLEDRHFEMRLAERQILTAEQRTQIAQWMQQHPQHGRMGNRRHSDGAAP